MKKLRAYSNHVHLLEEREPDARPGADIHSSVTKPSMGDHLSEGATRRER